MSEGGSSAIAVSGIKSETGAAFVRVAVGSGVGLGLMSRSSNSLTSLSCSLLLLRSVAIRWTVDSSSLIRVTSRVAYGGVHERCVSNAGHD